VSRDRSLEEFVGGASNDGDGSGTEPPEPDDPERGGPGRGGNADAGGRGGIAGGESTGVEPLTPTYRWSADDAACDACGERVEARWRGEEGFVCGDCKEW
jgi:hypothetical protein